MLTISDSNHLNEAMKMAAVRALAALTREAVPDIVNLAYNEKTISFGPDYIIPKALDPRLLSTVAPAVAKAAMETGVARMKMDPEDIKEKTRKLASIGKSE